MSFSLKVVAINYFKTISFTHDKSNEYYKFGMRRSQMKRIIYGAMLATLTMGATTMASEVITPADIDCSPTDQPVGRLLIASNRDFKRYGEGSFIVGTDGRLLLFYDRRKGSGDLDKSVIAVKQSLDRGKTWSGEKVVFEDEDASVIQPSLCRMANGRWA